MCVKEAKSCDVKKYYFNVNKKNVYGAANCRGDFETAVVMGRQLEVGSSLAAFLPYDSDVITNDIPSIDDVSSCFPAYV